MKNGPGRKAFEAEVLHATQSVFDGLKKIKGEPYAPFAVNAARYGNNADAAECARIEAQLDGVTRLLSLSSIEHAIPVSSKDVLVALNGVAQRALNAAGFKYRKNAQPEDLSAREVTAQPMKHYYTADTTTMREGIALEGLYVVGRVGDARLSDAFSIDARKLREHVRASCREVIRAKKAASRTQKPA